MKATHNYESNLPFDEQFEQDFINGEDNQPSEAIEEKDIYDAYNFYPDAGF